MPDYDSYFNSFYEVFEHIFKNEILEYDVYTTWHNGAEKSIQWKDLETQKTVENNEKLNKFVICMLDIAIRSADDTGGTYGVKTVFKNNEFGFLVWSECTSEMLEELDPEGCVDSKTFYSDDFIDKLKSYDIFESIDKNNLSDFINFKILHGDYDYFKLFDSVKNKWIDFDQMKIGEAISSLFDDLYEDYIYSKDEFNVVNDNIYFTDESVTYFTEEQTQMAPERFIPVSDVLDNM